MFYVAMSKGKYVRFVESGMFKPLQKHPEQFSNGNGSVQVKANMHCFSLISLSRTNTTFSNNSENYSKLLASLE